MTELIIFDEKVENLDGKYSGKTLVGFFTYKKYETTYGTEKELLDIQRRWSEEGMESLLELSSTGRNENRLIPKGKRPVESVAYVIGKQEYIDYLKERSEENSDRFGGVIAEATL